MLAQPVGAQHEAAGPERALVQAFDRLRVLGGLGQYGEREVAHDGRGIASGEARSIVPAAPISSRFSSC